MIIAPFVEESFEFISVIVTVTVSSTWSCLRIKERSDHRMISLIVTLCASCGGCGFSFFENLSHLTKSCYSLCEILALSFQSTNHPDFEVLMLGVARGIWYVPFHGCSAGIIADRVCRWTSREDIGWLKNSMLIHPVSTVGTMLLQGISNYMIAPAPWCAPCLVTINVLTFFIFI